MPFSAYTRMSGCDFNGTIVRKGAVDAICAFVEESGGTVAPLVRLTAERIGQGGGTPLAVSRNAEVLGVIHLKTW